LKRYIEQQFFEILLKQVQEMEKCRVCEIKKKHLMKSDISEEVLRDSESYNHFLKEAFPAYCASLRSYGNRD
jgi:hypothetical protein